MHNAMAIMTGSANQRSNTLCIRLWIDIIFPGLFLFKEKKYIFRGLENSLYVRGRVLTVAIIFLNYIINLKNYGFCFNMGCKTVHSDILFACKCSCLTSFWMFIISQVRGNSANS